MPRGDRKGPVGAGPATGRGLGFCTGFKFPGQFNSFSRRGFGGRRCGWMRWAGSVLQGCAYLDYCFRKQNKNELNRKDCNYAKRR